MNEESFEEAMRRLETIVQELETGDLPLEVALKKFEEGVRLSKLCSRKLDETEKKISILLKDPKGDLCERPFSPETGLEEDNRHE
jgi:exodeoxyribonuclease VII small subunit